MVNLHQPLKPKAFKELRLLRELPSPLVLQEHQWVVALPGLRFLLARQWVVGPQALQ